VVIWQFAHRIRPSDQRQANPGKGSRITLSDVSWNRSPKTLVIGVSAYCQYCRESAGLYRAFIAAARADRFQVVAVVREPESIARPLLPVLGLDGAGEVHYAKLEALGVRATPALFIVDRDGTIQSSWTGKLAGPQEDEVFSKLSIQNAPRRVATVLDPTATLPLVPENEVPALLANPKALVIDVRYRDDFNRSHIRGVLSMSLDEIESRARHELPPGEAIVVYCRSDCCNAQPEAATSNMGICRIAGRQLALFGGIDKVRYFTYDLCSLRRKGVPVVGAACN
jgi:rhodanese-related sulfurtransferase